MSTRLVHGPTSEPLISQRLRPLVGLREDSLVIHEIYRSLQGEGTFAGLPCVFIRLTACHLRCRYCDTAHAFHSGQTLLIEEVLIRALDLGDELVEVTGGEPLLQPAVFPLVERLADAGKVVLIETSGSLDIAPLDPRARVILDLKTPGSGEVDSNFWPNLDRLKATDEVKFVVCDRVDFDWSVKQTRDHRLTERCPVLISPMHGRVHAEDLAAWVLDSRLPLRLQLQLHKQVWGPGTRGV
jgi:7-carboxy-7-deazaguanine synthase